MSADLSLKNGDQYSLWAGMYHEYQTPKNPPLEWNMDSWNNNQGREIAKEIQKEYGDKFNDFPRQKQEDIIAAKVIYRMRNGELITNPTDPREYNGKIENIVKKHPEIFKEGEKRFNIGQPTGQAAGIEHIFTPEEIGKMTPEEFNKYESQIMAQVKAGKIEENQNNTKMYLINSPNTVLYTREDIGNMSTKE